jgi:hypothetical protein
MKKVILFLDMENILLIDLTWYIFPSETFRGRACRYLPEFESRGQRPRFLITYSSSFAGNALDLAFSCRRALRSNGPELNLGMGFMGSD